MEYRVKNDRLYNIIHDMSDMNTPVMQPLKKVSGNIYHPIGDGNIFDSYRLTENDNIKALYGNKIKKIRRFNLTPWSSSHRTDIVVCNTRSNKQYILKTGGSNNIAKKFSVYSNNQKKRIKINDSILRMKISNDNFDDWEYDSESFSENMIIERKLKFTTEIYKVLSVLSENKLSIKIV